MSTETEVSASTADTDPTAVGIGERVHAILSAAGLLPESTDRQLPSPADIGRLIRAFVQIHDPQIRSDFVALLEAIRGFAPR